MWEGGGGNNTTYILHITDFTGPSWSLKSCYTFWLLNHCFDTIYHWLYFLNILWILDFYTAFFYYLNCLIAAFSLSFHYFNFFTFLLTTTISLFSLFDFPIAHAFSLVFIDFTLFDTFLWFSSSFLLNNAFFLWFSC